MTNPAATATASESVTANNVVDGLALLRTIFANNTLATGYGSADRRRYARQAYFRALQTLTDALDSVADVTLAESVHQLLRGNTVRAGATLDAIARGDAPPPETRCRPDDRVRARRSRIGFSRLREEASAPGGQTRRAHRRSPASIAWACCHAAGSCERSRAGPVSPTARAVLSTIEFGLRHGWRFLRWICSRCPRPTGTAERLRRACFEPRLPHGPLDVPATAALALVDGRDSSWPATIVAVSELLVLVTSLGRLVSGSRAMTPQDLVFPGDPAGSIDTTEFQSRADDAETQIRAALTAVGASGGPRHRAPHRRELRRRQCRAFTRLRAMGCPGGRRSWQS